MLVKKGVLSLIGVLLVGLLIGGCGPAIPGDAAGAATPGDAEAAETGANPAGALQAALDYLAQAYGELAPASDLSWQKVETEPSGLVGAETVRYAAGDWTAEVAYPIVAPENTLYTVTVSNEAAGFAWQGEVDAGLYVNATHPGMVAALRVALQAVEAEQQLKLPELTSWTAAQTTPEGLMGRDDWLFEAGDWQATISFPVVAPEYVIYTVVLTDPTTGFRWEGQVDAAGRLVE